ncbi:MAG: SDR family oxidoreductase [Acetobacteraceae bacterium]|nr:SDR family oxidoreductase [Acetobacteraceae bacterium]
MASERKVAIVTGAASGIGRAITLGLLGAGVDVAGVDRDRELLAELQRIAQGLPGTLSSVLADLADPAAFDRVVSEVTGAAGRIDVLVNNAGIGQGSVRADQRRNPINFWEITPEQWNRFVAVNATAGLMMAKAVVPHMLRAGRGRIVSVTTSLGTMIRRGYVLYGASKAAFEAATAVMAADLAGTGVTANVLVPGGMTDTRIVTREDTPERDKLLRPEIMVPPLLWLISDEAREVTGRRFLAVHWDRSLPGAEAAAKCGAGIAWTSIATMPIEPD